MEWNPHPTCNVPTTITDARGTCMLWYGRRCCLVQGCGSSVPCTANQLLQVWNVAVTPVTRCCSTLTHMALVICVTPTATCMGMTPRLIELPPHGRNPTRQMAFGLIGIAFVGHLGDPLALSQLVLASSLLNVTGGVSRGGTADQELQRFCPWYGMDGMVVGRVVAQAASEAARCNRMGQGMSNFKEAAMSRSRAMGL